MKSWITIIIFLFTIACGSSNHKDVVVVNESKNREDSSATIKPLSPDVEKKKMEDSSRVVESLYLDFDGDGKKDHIRLLDPPGGDPGEFNKIEIELANGNLFHYKSPDAWDFVDKEVFSGFKNELQSDMIFSLHHQEQKFLFLFGYQFGCCAKQLTIITCVDSFPKAIFDAEFEIKELKDFNNDDTLEIIGRDNFYEIITIEDSVQIGTYAPFKVFNLTSVPSFQEDLSKRYNEEHYVYVDSGNIEDIRIAYPTKGYDFRPFVIENEKKVVRPYKKDYNSGEKAGAMSLKLNQVYAIGADTHLDGCEFQFRCDCCSGNLIFLEDSTYYYADYCMSDISVTRGRFKVVGDSLKLQSDGICVKEAYNWERESNPEAQQFFIKDTVMTPYSMAFWMDNCNGKEMLIKEDQNGTSVALATEKDVQFEMQDLEDKGILAGFKSREN